MTASEENILVPDGLRAGIQLLIRAADFSADLHCDRWELAVPVGDLTRLGMMSADLQWLFSKGFIECGKEVTLPGEPVRSFRKLGLLSTSPETGFVLTDRGEAVLRNCKSSHSPAPAVIAELLPAVHAASAARPRAATLIPLPKPIWDQGLRELHFSGKLVKQFRVPAANQEAILAAFEEEGWPSCIDDPLPQQAHRKAAERLQATLKSLNSRQVHSLLWFHGNGSGSVVLWETRRLDNHPAN